MTTSLRSDVETEILDEAEHFNDNRKASVATLRDRRSAFQESCSTYKSHGGHILMAKTMQAESGAVFNYMLAAFEKPAKHRFELNFVKVVYSSKGERAPRDHPFPRVSGRPAGQ